MRRDVLSALLCAAILTTAAEARAGALRALASDGGTCWAAGDGGTILRSGDGGRTWQRLTAPVAANFQSIQAAPGEVFFYGGAAVTGHPHGAGTPYIARTADGGKSFQLISPGQAGWLYGGCFAGATGITYGQAGFAAPGGILRTIDGGRLWGPAAVSGQGFLLGGDFRSPRYGYAVGARHRIVSIRNLAEPRLHPPAVASALALRAVQFADREEGVCWCVGDNGMVLRSRTAGRPWDPVAVPLPPGVRLAADLEALTFASPQRAWVAGGPVGVVLHTDSAGGAWQLLPAPPGGCIHALLHLAGDTLLAAGDGERIWRSEDGGRTWKLTHGRQQTDVLFILAATDRSAYPAMVAHAMAGCSVAAVYATSLAGGGAALGASATPPDQPLRAAAAKAGADGIAALTEFPSVAGDPAAGELTEDDISRRWSTELDMPAEPEMVRQLAAAIRLYRPLVLAVGTDDPNLPGGAAARGAEAEARLISRLAQRAAQLAAAEDARGLEDFPRAGLAGWAVRRVFVGLAGNQRWYAPWESPPPADRKAARVSFDASRFPADSNIPLELLAADAAWALPGSDLLDRPGQSGAYGCRVLDGPVRLFTTGLGDVPAGAGGRLVLSAREAQRRDLASCGSLRAAILADQTPRAATELMAALQEAKDPDTCRLVGDRLLLAWRRLLMEGRFIEADMALAVFSRKSRHHSLGRKIDVLTLAATVSSEWQAQLAARGLPKKMDLATLERAAEAFAGWAPWALTPEGRMLHAKALVAAGKLPQARQVLAALAREPYPEHWRACAMLELGDENTLEEALRARRQATAGFTADKGQFEGRLDEPCWQKAEALRLSRAGGPLRRPVATADPNAARSRLPEVQAVRSAGGFILFSLRLPRVVGRRWDVEFAIDADRDDWTQVVLRCDTEARSSASLLFRDGPAAALVPSPAMFRIGRTEEEWTAELAVSLNTLHIQVPPAELWNFQVRATAHDMAERTVYYYQPQDDTRLLPERYGLLKVPGAEPAGPKRPGPKP